MPDRDAVSDLLPVDQSREIIKGFLSKSAAMQLMRRVSMKQRERRLPIIEVLPDEADFLPEDDSLKPISELSYTHKELIAAPIATIVYFPDDVVDDLRSGAGIDIWEQVRPLIEEDIARKLDNAVFFGVGAPAVWDTAIVPAAIAAGNVVNEGTGVDIFDDVNTAMMAVEADGYDVDGHWARQAFRGVIRNERDAARGFLYPPSGPANTGAANADAGGVLFGQRLVFSKAGLSGFDDGAGNARLITGDWDQAILGVRSDLTWKKLDQATLYNSDMSVRVALPQQDTTAVRVVGRFAFLVPNPINRMRPTEADRYPFAVVRETPAG